MRGKISCSAQRLSLLEPSMIQSVVEPPAFQIANQYLAENRVRIVEADESQISSVVIGNSGVYDQTVRLKDGSLGNQMHLYAERAALLPAFGGCPARISSMDQPEKRPSNSGSRGQRPSGTQTCALRYRRWISNSVR